MQKLSANQRLIRKHAETYEKITPQTMVFAALLLVGTYICMMLPIVKDNRFFVGQTLLGYLSMFGLTVLPLVSGILCFRQYRQDHNTLSFVSIIVFAALFVVMLVMTILFMCLEGWLVSFLANLLMGIGAALVAAACGTLCLLSALGVGNPRCKIERYSKLLITFAIVSFVYALTLLIFAVVKPLALGSSVSYFIYTLRQSLIPQLMARGDALQAVSGTAAGQLAQHGYDLDLLMAYGSILLMLAATLVFILNRYKNKTALAVSVMLNAVALLMIFGATSSLGSWNFGTGKTFSYTIAAMMLLFAAAILYLNVFQYIKGYGKYGLTFALPFFLVFAIFQLYPIYFTFRTSLTDADGWEKILNNEIIGFANFKKLFTFNEDIGFKIWDPSEATTSQITSYVKLTENFWGSFGNTIIMWVFNFVPQIGMALLLASWFTDTRLRLKFQGGFKVLIFMPNIITAATIGMLFMSLFSYPVAPVNTLLQNLGILNSPFEYWRDMYASRGIVSFIQWWMWYGNTMIVMIAGILGINPSLFEAALVDGCSARQTFWRITLPLIKPILLYNLVTSLVGGMTMFDIPHLMTQGAPDNTTNTVARFIYTQAFTGGNNFNVATAASVVLFIIIVICSLIMSSIMKDRSGVEKKRRAVK